MKFKSLAVCGLLLWAGSSAAPAQAPKSELRRGFVPPECTISLSLMFGAESLDDLIAESTYIVEVTVISAFPATGGTRAPPLVSTDFVVAPQRVLKGQLAAERFVIGQPGGQLDGRKHCSSQFPGGLMSPGQRYIIFFNDPLEFEIDPDRWQREGLRRFVTTFGYQGVVLVEQDEDKVELSRDVPFRDGYAGMSTAQFMDEVATKARANIIGKVRAARQMWREDHPAESAGAHQ